MAELPGISREWVARYVDLSVKDAVALAESEGRPVRVLGPGMVTTADLRTNRLNIFLDERGNTKRIYAG